MLATGEEVPQGESIRARLLIIEVNAADVKHRRLSDCQWAGQEGRFAESMGAFVSWIAGRYEEVQHHRQGRLQRGYGLFQPRPQNPAGQDEPADRLTGNLIYKSVGSSLVSHDVERSADGQTEKADSKSKWAKGRLQAWPGHGYLACSLDGLVCRHHVGSIIRYPSSLATVQLSIAGIVLLTDK